jgi:uncharacterized membrane protein
MNWAGYALRSAFFEALVATFGKIGVRDVESKLAVAIRTVGIVFFVWGIVLTQPNAGAVARISRHWMGIRAGRGSSSKYQTGPRRTKDRVCQG